MQRLCYQSHILKVDLRPFYLVKVVHRYVGFDSYAGKAGFCMTIVEPDSNDDYLLRYRFWYIEFKHSH